MKAPDHVHAPPHGGQRDTPNPTPAEPLPPRCLSLTVRHCLLLLSPKPSAHMHPQSWPRFAHRQDTQLLLRGQCATGRHVPPRPTSHTPRRQIPRHVGARSIPAPPRREVCPSPRLSGAPGTAGMAPTRKNHHSRRIASAVRADASSAVQMMIKCYCVRESSKEGLISFIVGKGSAGPPAPNSRTGLTQCMPGTPGSHVHDRDRDPSSGPPWTV